MGTWNRNQICQEIRVEEDLEVLSGRFFHLVELRECTRERGPEVNAVSRAGSPCFCVTGHLNQMARFPEPAWLHDRNREINNGTRLEFLLLLKLFVNGLLHVQFSLFSLLKCSKDVQRPKVADYNSNRYGNVLHGGGHVFDFLERPLHTRFLFRTSVNKGLPAKSAAVSPAPSQGSLSNLRGLARGLWFGARLRRITFPLFNMGGHLHEYVVEHPDNSIHDRYAPDAWR